MKMSIPELKMATVAKIHKIVTLSLTAIFCLLSSSIAAAFAVPSISPTSFNFGNVAINEASAVETFTLKNNESSAVSITSVGLTAGTPYGFDPSTTCGTTVTTLAPSGQAGSTCVIGVTITPTVTGAQPGTLTIVTSVNTLNVTLKATGVNPVVVAPTSLTFAAQFEGTTSAPPKIVTLTNEQLVPLPITSASISGPNAGDFGLPGSTCPISPPTSLGAAPANCGISVNFTPTGSGTRTATLNVVVTVLGSLQTLTIPLKGSGNAPVTLTPNSITNFTAKVGTTSAARTITLKNANPNVALHISNLQFSGDFEQTATTCPLAPAALGGSGTTATCTISITFNPSIGGIRDGQLQVNDDASTSPQVLNLQGTGTSPL